MGSSKCHYRANRSEKVVQNVAPVTKHVDHDATSVFRAVIPRGSLSFLPISFKNPITELSANGKDSAKKSVLNESLQFSQTGQEQLVLNYAILNAGSSGQFCKLPGSAKIVGDRFLTIDVLSRAIATLMAEARSEVT